MAPLGPSPLAPLRLPTAFESEWTQWASGVNIGTYRSRFPKLDEPVVDQQPSVEQPQQEERPPEIQDITPEKEEVNGEDPVNHNEEKEKDASGAESMHFLVKILTWKLISRNWLKQRLGVKVEMVLMSGRNLHQIQSLLKCQKQVKGNHLLERR
ncbi:uncharacterized protein [Bos taurus]|uniref:uncharacterized protein isoform X2 n=1 Tax=Bos taurus TaxID=9913 RepID=UPI000D5398DE|nr:uncharacterized protein LOC101902810 isoform X2 [Bos taurus]